MSYETLNKALGRIVELEAALAHQTKCRLDSDRKLMAADDMLNATAYQLAEAREDSARLDYAIGAYDLPERAAIDAARGRP